MTSRRSDQVQLQIFYDLPSLDLEVGYPDNAVKLIRTKTGELLCFSGLVTARAVAGDSIIYFVVFILKTQCLAKDALELKHDC